MNMNKTNPSSNIEEFSNALTYIELLLIGVVMISICVVTVIGNALVVISFILDKKLRTLNNYFLLSLAVSDGMIATFSMPIFTAYLLIGQWTFGPAVCDMWLAQDYTCSNASCLNLLMIAVDRYFSVTDPLHYRAKRTAKRVGMMICCVWIISFLLWPPWIYAWPYIEGNRTVPEDDCYIQFLETNTYVTIITVVLDYYVPVLIILVLYYKIWRETRKRGQYLAKVVETDSKSESISFQTQNCCNENNKMGLMLRASPGSFPRSNVNQDNPAVDGDRDEEAAVALLTEKEDEISSESNVGRNDCQISRDFRTSDHNSSFSSQSAQSKTSSTRKGGIKQDKAARVLTIILLAFIVTTTPYNVVVIIANLDHTIISVAVWNFFYYLFYINSTLNPLCYALGNENFRRTYWRILTCSWNRKPQGAYSISSYSNKSSESKISYDAKHAISSL